MPTIKKDGYEWDYTGIDRTIEKSRVLLRAYLLQNKDRVISDLQELREKSEGNDLNNYLNQFGSSCPY